MDYVNVLKIVFKIFQLIKINQIRIWNSFAFAPISGNFSDIDFIDIDISPTIFTLHIFIKKDFAGFNSADNMLLKLSNIKF